MRDPCLVCDGTGKLEDESADDVTSMRVCANCGGTGETPVFVQQYKDDEEAMTVVARHPTQLELDQGYLVCGCGKFAHVFRAEVLRKLPEHYHGERCPECNFWMVDVKLLNAR